ncbi:MAG: DUF1062 domain-containing protein [Christensenella sp.]|uniref:DUF1062 domain-containing protein n=1 Tax=Christensenella sp. TaxID=1935934 RepID=UPI002B1F37CA|nr:DUF1062 domain-containing protein [Christensenella sp.]MEA5004363.1 DUF1062 domain-containing protein [Christensenella sp.]
MKTIIWEVKIFSPPEAIRYCAKCGRPTGYIPTGAFRINAQQKQLDIWLIYQCVHCGCTWNLTIYSRVNPQSVGRELLERFMKNDGSLVWKYAMDVGLLERNGAIAGMPRYEIAGSAVDFAQDVAVRIVSAYPLRQRVAKLLREKLAISKRSFEEMAVSGAIRLENGGDVRKCKLQREAVVLIAGTCSPK